MADFDALWRAAVRYRRVSRELEPLAAAMYAALGHRDLTALRASLDALLVFLADKGFTDANCCAIDLFVQSCEDSWRDLPEPYRTILDDMSGTLHDAVYAPKIAETFESLPKQLLARVRAVG